MNPTSFSFCTIKMLVYASRYTREEPFTACRKILDEHKIEPFYEVSYLQAAYGYVLLIG